MLQILKENAWLLGLRGGFGILFGLMELTVPGMSPTAAAMGFGAYAMADGWVAAYLGFLDYGDGNRWWELILEGVLGIAVGGVAYFRPDQALFYVALWALITGVLEIIQAIRLRRDIPDEFFLVLAGSCSVALGLLLGLRSFASALSLKALLVGYGLGFGVFLLALMAKLQRPSPAAPAS